MTSISDVSTTASATLASAAGANSVMGKDDFLKLLVAQLQHQDPLNPSDPTEFTAQLSQFSSLEQLFAVNDNLEKMVTENGGMERFSALSLIDREVVSISDSFRLGANGSVELGYQLDRPANSVNLIIQDQQGLTLANLPATETEAGDHYLSWDGTDAAGNIIPPGEYRMLVSAQRSADDVFTGTALVKGVVTGVDLNGSENLLITDAGNFLLANVMSVRSQEQ